jgi:rubredoxin
MSEAEEIRKLITLLESETLVEGAPTDGRGPWRFYKCVPCGYIYSEEKGDPMAEFNMINSNLPEEDHYLVQPGTRWEDIDIDLWMCPECGADKNSFVQVFPDPNKPGRYIER